MSCACLNKSLSEELERALRLARVLARIEGSTVAVYRKADGTYGFCPASSLTDEDIVEYITPY